MYGNYCGPYWSDGKYQASVVGNEKPIDELDRTCMVHDSVYALGGNLEEADFAFYNANIGRGVRRSVYGAAVGAQGLIRYGVRSAPNISNILHRNITTLPNMSKMTGTKLRGAAKAPARGQFTPNPPQTSSIGGVQITAPAAISNVFTAQRTRTRSIKDGVHISGREFIAPVEGQGVSTFGLGKAALLAPAYFYAGVLGQLCRAYQTYRWRKLVVHYIPKVSTNTTGQVVLCSSENIVEPALQPEANTFLARAMVSGNGVMGPCWMPFKMEIECDSKYRHIDPTVNVDINDNVFAEVQCYSQVGVAQQLGYLWLEYEIELIKPMLTPHSTSLPLLTGPGQRITISDLNAVNAVANPVTVADSSNSGLFAQPGGTIYRLVFDFQTYVPGTGTNATNAWNTVTLNVGSNLAVAGTTVQLGTGSYAINGGDVVYLALTQGQTYGVLFTSLESAVAGFASGTFIQRTASTGKFSIACDATLVRLGLSTLPSIQ